MAIRAERSALSASRDLLDNAHPALRRCWHPVARSVEVTEAPRRVWLVGEPWVAVRLAGEAVVLADRCPHRLAPLSEGRVVDDLLQCAYHGWRFGRDGGCAAVPSLGAEPGRALPPRAHARAPFGVVERYGLVFVAIDEPLVPLPELDVFDEDRMADPESRYVEMGPYEGPYGAGQLIDNQIDASHFAILHRETFGNDAAAELPPFEVVRSEHGFAVDFDVPISARNDPAAAAGIRPVEQYRRMHYRYLVPFHLVLHLEYPVMGGDNTIVFWVQPETAERCRMYITLRLSQPGGFTDRQLADRIEFETRVVQEDLDLQATFDHQSLPLDPRIECHVKVDRAALEYRRLLRALVDQAAGVTEVAALGEDAQVTMTPVGGHR